MEKNNAFRLSTEPYKGVRDFYPHDMAIQNYIFDVMRKTVESFGYAEYSASILEPAELYRAKSGDEIVNEQTYTFTDRGGREVTLRPEMTPTVARMVAAKRRELSFPVRWYSIPNLFRYERPQRGRLREHWQLNVDLFGAEGIEAEMEIISIAYRLMKNFGMRDENFEIHLNHRGIFAHYAKRFGVPESKVPDLIKLFDRMKKMSEEDFKTELTALIEKKNEAATTFTMDALFKEATALVDKDEAMNIGVLQQIIGDIKDKTGIENIVFDPSIARGFDYYNGLVFEVFDNNPNNNRSLFGGGRYDGLTGIFGEPDMPAVGFGMGDVTIRDVLGTYDLIPESVKRSKTDLYIGALGEAYVGEAQNLARRLREKGLNVATDLSGTKKMDNNNKKAAKDAIPFIVCVGEEEARDKTYRVKDLASWEVSTVKEDEMPIVVKKESKKLGE